MVSKILLVVLISCTAVLASPINRKNASLESEESTQELPAFIEFLKNTFGKLLGKFFSVIVDSLKKVFDKIEQRLESKEFTEAVAELKKITDIIFNDQGQLQGDDETKEVVEKQLEKVGEAFQQLLDEAIENLKENNDKKIDATKFKDTVDELKQLVDKLYSK